MYSEHLKEVLQLSQERTDDIGAAKDFGYSFGIVGGLLYNFYPPFVTVSIGALLHFVGYMTVSIKHRTPDPFEVTKKKSGDESGSKSPNGMVWCSSITGKS